MVKKAAFFLAVVVILGIVLVGCGSKQAGLPASVAKVDGNSIPGSMYYEYLSAAWGRQVLPMLVEQQVLQNWASKEGVPVTDKQLDKQIENMKRDGTFEDQVASVGTEQALRDRYREIQARVNIGEKLYKFTDSELLTIYNNPAMKRRFVHGPRKRVEIIVSTDPKKIAEADKAIKGGMDFDAAAMKYSDPQFVMGGPAKTPVSLDKGQGPEGLQKAAKDTKLNEVSKPFSFVAGQFGILNGMLKVLGDQPKADLKFAEVKDEIKAMAALQKASTDPTFQKKLDEQKKKADIVIELPQYKYMVDSIKNPAPQAGMGMPQQMRQAPKGGAAAPK